MRRSRMLNWPSCFGAWNQLVLNSKIMKENFSTESEADFTKSEKENKVLEHTGTQKSQSSRAANSDLQQQIQIYSSKYKMESRIVQPI